MPERSNQYFVDIIAAQNERTIRALAVVLALETLAMILALIRKR